MLIADEFGFKIATLQHALEAYKIAPEIAAHGASCSTFADWWAYKVEAEDAIPYSPALMVRRGVLVSIKHTAATPIGGHVRTVPAQRLQKAEPAYAADAVKAVAGFEQSFGADSRGYRHA